ncbi:DUF4030 domain-containing protein [Bacillus salipaludis]|uniref:DUF4030 domain-containing protein n=1 Tax=Bacillus salipaludis TaxID=2547811 RepID=UPI002E1F0550|nr:DUF4030 domain-containing protein [Bacillus salipaludis]
MRKQYEDTEFDIPLKKLDSDFLWKTKQKQELKKRIITDIEQLENNTRIKKTLLPLRSKKVSLIKTLTYSGIVLTLLFGLFIGSAFISPAMAKVVSKIPYLGQIFDSKNNIVSNISEELKSKGYTIAGVGVSYPKKEINIQIKSTKKDFNAIKQDVENIAESILQSRNYDAYRIKVSKYKEYKDEVNEEEEQKRKKFNDESQIIYTALTKELKNRNYNVLQLGMRYSPKTIEIEIPNTETRIDELKQIVEDTIKANNIESIPLDIKKINMKKREQGRRWGAILNIVGEDLLGKKEYKVRMVGYSVHPEPEIQAFITMPSSDKNAKDFAQQLEEVIDKFLESDEMKSRIKNDPYHITIYSKDDKILNK